MTKRWLSIAHFYIKYIGSYVNGNFDSFYHIDDILCHFWWNLFYSSRFSFLIFFAADFSHSLLLRMKNCFGVERLSHRKSRVSKRFLSANVVTCIIFVHFDEIFWDILQTWWFPIFVRLSSLTYFLHQAKENILIHWPLKNKYFANMRTNTLNLF